MVHRAPDSRLLTNLIASEKDYSKHLAALFPIAQSALASLSAYASASPSSPARTIATVVDLLASADDALQRYNDAIDSWRNQLTSLKSLEDDLSAVLRDRDILITRLIKVSKTTREAHRSSRIVAPLTGLGSSSLASLSSTNSTTATHTVSGSSPSITNSKLAQAQAELQACEAHLVTKEHELDARRISIARDGLGARCRALIDCGWVWSEMGKQGLKTLQALSINGVAQSSVPLNPTYGSDNSSVTPSQSASQTAVQSAEMSHEAPTTSKEPHRTTSEPEATSTTRTTRTQDQGDVTITLPPPHAISELTLPTIVRSPLPLNGDPAQKHNGINAKPTIAPAPRRKRMNRPRRPPSQHIAEVSGEDSDGHRNPVDAGVKLTAHTPFPTTPDTSSEEEQPVGPFKIVENDPFEMIRKSIIAPSPSVPHLPTIPTVSSNGHISAETSPSKTAVSTVDPPGPGRGTVSSLKRERRTSMAFFGSLRGLFRKPKDKEKAETEWDEGYSSPKSNGNVRGPAPVWVTRTDARIKGKSREVDSDQEATPAVSVGRGKLGTRLRKGRPRRMNESAPSPQDGWATDSHGMDASMSGLDRSGTHRGTVKPKKLSVADLRGSEQGHTDAEVDGRVSGKARAVEEHGNHRESFSRGVQREKGRVEEEQKRVLSRRESVSKNAIVDLDVEHGRTATTSPTLNRKSSVTHRRSASLSLVDTHAATSSSTGSWQKPAVESAPRVPRPASPSRTASTKPQVKRQFGNGHVTHAKNQSLMSIVVDVTGQVPSEEDRTRSLDIPRAPGSVLKETTEVGRRASLAIGDDAAHGQGPGRGQALGQGRGRGVVKMPLRSALRNASRTPSPSPEPVIVDAKKKREEERDLLRDSMSISSYETVRETLDGEEDGEETPPPFTFPPPPVDPPPTVVRRKSVRVSLQPTFSPSPPASPALPLRDDDAELEVGRNGSEDMWADSTSEEEVYTRARGLLMVQGKNKGKGKAR